MVNWLRNFWYHDTIDEMQRKQNQLLLSIQRACRRAGHRGPANWAGAVLRLKARTPEQVMLTMGMI